MALSLVRNAAILRVGASSLGVENMGRKLGLFGPGSEPPEQRGMFVTENVPRRTVLGFLPEEDLFSARNVRLRSESHLIDFAKDAMLGYEELRDVDRTTFDELELSVLLFLERRSKAIGSPSIWAPWLQEVPWSCPGNGAFLTKENVDTVMNPLDKENEEEFQKFQSIVARRDHVISLFFESLGFDLAEAFAVLENSDAWGLDSRMRAKMPFQELLREELSLVMSRGVNLPSSVNSFEKSNTGSFCILPGFDFINHSGAMPNAELVLPFESDGSKGVALCSLRNLQQGEEVLVSYGPRTTAEMLLRFGFWESGTKLFEKSRFANDQFTVL